MQTAANHVHHQCLCFIFSLLPHEFAAQCMLNLLAHVPWLLHHAAWIIACPFSNTASEEDP